MYLKRFLQLICDQFHSRWYCRSAVTAQLRQNDISATERTRPGVGGRFFNRYWQTNSGLYAIQPKHWFVVACPDYIWRVHILTVYNALQEEIYTKLYVSWMPFRLLHCNVLYAPQTGATAKMFLFVMTSPLRTRRKRCLRDLWKLNRGFGSHLVQTTARLFSFDGSYTRCFFVTIITVSSYWYVLWIPGYSDVDMSWQYRELWTKTDYSAVLILIRGQT